MPTKWERERATGKLPNGASPKDRAANGADVSNRASASAKKDNLRDRLNKDRKK